MGTDEVDDSSHSDSHSATDTPKTVRTDQETMCNLMNMQVSAIYDFMYLLDQTHCPCW